MIALLQRVSEAGVEVDGVTISHIGAGLLVLLCAEKGDTLETAKVLAQKTAKLRIFADDNGRMNRSALDTRAEVLVVSQFTLAADCSSGNRPSFTRAAAPELGRELWLAYAQELSLAGLNVQLGRFGAHMRVFLVNDGPVTVQLQK